MTLVEALVALIIFALGIAGGRRVDHGQFALWAGLQQRVCCDEPGARLWRTDAVDPRDRCLQRQHHHLPFDTAGQAVETGVGTLQAPAQPSSTNTCVLNTCNTAGTNFSTKMLAFSTWEWAQRVQSALPAGRVGVCSDSSPKENGLYKWDCDGLGNMRVVKFGWRAKTGPTGTGDDILVATDSSGAVRPKMVITLFGNQADFVTP